MKYGYDFQNGREITAEEYAEKLKAINNALKGKKRVTPSLFFKKRTIH